MAMLDASRTDLSDRAYDRAHHVITENQRVLDAVTALEECVVDDSELVHRAAAGALEQLGHAVDVERIRKQQKPKQGAARTLAAFLAGVSPDLLVALLSPRSLA
ncbi:MAG: hypothetical protein ACC726_11850, partial [Chloroflexota bacterium]